MNSVEWTAENKTDTNIVARGFSCLKAAKVAVTQFCAEESAKLGGSYLNKIVADNGFEYPDDQGVYYFSTDCITA